MVLNVKGPFFSPSVYVLLKRCGNPYINTTSAFSWNCWQRENVSNPAFQIIKGIVNLSNLGTMASGAEVLDYRSVLEQKLSAKRDALGQTEQNLKRFVGNNSAGNGRVTNLFRNRLGPAVNAQDKRRPLGNRLGPKIDPKEDDSSSKSILSRVVVEQKSREEALAQQQKTSDKKEKMVKRVAPTSHSL